MIDHIATQANEEKSPYKSAHFSRHQHQIIFFDDIFKHFFKRAKHRSANNDSAKNNPSHHPIIVQHAIGDGYGCEN